MAVRTNVRAALVLFAAAGAGAACGENGDPTGPRGGTGLAEVALPAPVGDARFSTDLIPFQPRVQWGDNGQTVYFMPNVGPPFGVHTLDIATGSAEVIVEGSGNILHVSDDREFLYYTLGQGSTAIYRLATAGGQPELLVPAAQHVFSISADGRWLAWTASHVDSLYVRDLATDETTAVAAATGPVSISPNGQHLVHRSPQGFVLTSLVTGVSTGLLPADARVLDVRWDATGAELLVARSGILEIVRPGAGDPVPIWTGPAALMVDAAAWSPDGAHVVASIRAICLSNCTSWLLLIDPTTGSVTVLASTSEFIGAARFTPDGQTIAIATGGRLYVLPLPAA